MTQGPWHLGQTSEHYETGGRGPGSISHTPGDPGGPSYGLSQFALNTGSLREYLDHSRYAEKFHGLELGSHAFDAKWREVAKTDSTGFAQDQRAFTKAQFYDVQNARLKVDGLDLSQRGPAVQDALWSTSVQFRGLTPGIFEKGLEDKFGKSYNLSGLSDKDVVGAVQDYKITHNDHLFHRSSAAVKASVLERAKEEKVDLLKLADGQSIDHARHGSDTVAPPLSQGAHDQAVVTLQADLAKLGYTDHHGKPLAADGDFGIDTRHAVERFQHEHHLAVNGKVGPRTQAILNQAMKAHNAQATLLLTDPKNPDHRLFAQALAGVHRIDADMGRTPDQASTNLAAALTVAAKQHGLTRIDAVGISADGARTSILQNDPLRPGIIADVTTAQAVHTPMEQSSATARAVQPAAPLPAALSPLPAMHQDASVRAI